MEDKNKDRSTLDDLKKELQNISRGESNTVKGGKSGNNSGGCSGITPQ